MSSAYLGEIWNLPLPTTEKLLLAFLADNATYAGFVPAMRTDDLARVCGRTVKTTRAALKDLTDRGYLDRSIEPWAIITFPGVQPRVVEEPQPQLTLVDKQTAPAPDPTPPEIDAESPASDLPTTRLSRFCQAWGLTSPSDSLVRKWEELEKTEAKYNRKEKHRSDEGETWVKTIEAIEESMPAILHAVAVFQARAEAGLPNHAETPAAFVDRELWLAPEYQVPIDKASNEVAEIDTDEIDEMVAEMNRAGGSMSCHYRVTSKNPHTGEMETETDEIYANRVRAKYDQFKATAAYFQE